MKQILTLTLFILCSLASKSQPRNIQCKVVEVIENKKNLVKCKCISMDGEIVFLEYSWRGWRSKNRLVKVGSWFSVDARFEDKEGEKYFTRIKLNQ